MIREGLPEKVFEQRLRRRKGEEHFKQEKRQVQRLEGGAKPVVQGETGRLAWLMERKRREGWGSDKG